MNVKDKNISRKMSNKPKILLIDDDELVLRITKKNLIKKGYDVDTAVDAESAIELLNLHPSIPPSIGTGDKPKTSNYDLIISDVKMPGMQGTELFNLVHEKTGGELPVLLMTGVPKPEDALRIANRNGTYISKPGLAKLYKTIHEKIGSPKSNQTYTYNEKKSNVLFLHGRGDNSTIKYISRQMKLINREGHITFDTTSITGAAEKIIPNEINTLVLDLTVNDKFGFEEIIERVSRTYPFVSIIANGEGLKYNQIETITPSIFHFMKGAQPNDEYDQQLVQIINKANKVQTGKIVKALDVLDAPGAMIISGPGLSGKSRLAEGLTVSLPGIVELIPRYVSREKRPFEHDGNDHIFVDDAYFVEHADEFLYTFMHRNDYKVGIKKSHIRFALENGRDAIIIAATSQNVFDIKRKIETYVGTVAKSMLLFANPDVLKDRSARRDWKPKDIGDTEAEFNSFRYARTKFDHVLMTSYFVSDDESAFGIQHEEMKDLEATIHNVSKLMLANRGMVSESRHSIF